MFDIDYAGSHITRLSNLGPIATFIQHELPNGRCKHLKTIDQAHFSCLLQTLLSTVTHGDDLSSGLYERRD